MASSKRGKAASSRKENSSGPVNDLEDLDEEMAKVNVRAGGGKTCLRSLVISRHLAGEKLGVRLAAAKTVLETFNGLKPRPKEAVLLEHRIRNCEFAAMLATHCRSMNKPAMTQAVACMASQGIELPLKIRLQLVERHVNETLALSFETDAATSKTSAEDKESKPQDDKEEKKLTPKEAAKNVLKILLIVPDNIMEEENLIESTFATLVELTKSRHALEMTSVEAENEAKAREQHEQDWEVVQESMTEGFCSDGLTSVLSNPEQHSIFLEEFLTGFLQGMNEGSDEFKELPDLLQQVCLRARQVFRAFACLFFPIMGHLGAEVGHVSSLKKYTGKNSFEATMSKIISEPFWEARHDELLRKCGTARLMEPTFKQVTNALLEDSDGYEAMAALELAAKQLQGLRDGMREGSTRFIEAKMGHILDERVGSVLNSDGTTVKPSLVEVIIHASKMLGRDQMVQKLLKWKKQCATALSWRSLEEEVAKINMTSSQELASVDLKPLAEAISKCSETDPLPQSTLTALEDMVPKLLRLFKMRVEGVVHQSISKAEFTCAELAVNKCTGHALHEYFGAQLALIKNGISYRAQLQAIDQLGNDAGARVAADPQGKKLDLFMKVRRDLVTSMQALVTVETKFPRDDQDEHRTLHRKLMADCGVLSVFKAEVSNNNHKWKDMFSLQLAELTEEVMSAIKSLGDHSQSYELPGKDSWKPEEGFKDYQHCMRTADVTIAQLKGGVVTRHVEQLEKAIMSLEKFLGRFQDMKTSLAEERDAAVDTIGKARERTTLAKALVCEALLRHGLSQKVKSTGKDLVRNQLAEVAGGSMQEEQVCGLLLEAARRFIG